MLHSLQRHRELAIDLSASINPNGDSHEKNVSKQKDIRETRGDIDLNLFSPKKTLVIHH